MKFESFGNKEIISVHQPQMHRNIHGYPHTVVVHILQSEAFSDYVTHFTLVVRTLINCLLKTGVASFCSMK